MGDSAPYLWAAVSGQDSDDSNTCNQFRNNSDCISPGSVAMTVVSSTASIVGSLLIICTFFYWKDLRTIARMILVFLAIADLFTGIGYIFAAGVYLHYFYSSGYCSNDSHVPEPIRNSTYRDLCIAQSFVTTVMPMASFFWTANLAIYLFFSVIWMKVKFAKIMMVIFHITAWGIPLITCIVLVSKGFLGESESQTSGGWCWITSDGHRKSSFYLAEAFAGKGWEIIVYILSLAICIAIKVIVWRRVKNPKKVVVESEYSSLSIERQMQAAYSKLDQKLIWLPIAFLLLRIWGNIRFFVSIGCSQTSDNHTLEHCCHVLYHPSLVVLQSIGDPGQGWSNALLFVLFNQKIAQRLCPCLSPLAEWFCMRFKCLDPRGWRGVRGGPIKPVVAAVGGDTKGGGGRKGRGAKGDRDPLLNSMSSTTSVTTNFSTSSVLYSSNAGDNTRVNFSKPRNPSINSAKSSTKSFK